MVIADVNWLLGEIATEVAVETVQEVEPTDDKRKLENINEAEAVIEIRKLREESRKRRLETEALKKQIADIQQSEIERKKQEEIAKLSEIEKEKALREEALIAKAEAEKRADDAVGFVKDMLRRSTVEKVADELGFRNPKLAISLYGDIKEIDITDGEVVDVQNIKDKLNKMLEEETYLRKAVETSIVKSPEQLKEPVKVKNPASSDVEKEELIRLQKEAMDRGDGIRALSYYLKANKLVPK